MLGLEERNAELARLGALVQGDRLVDEILADLDAIEHEVRGKLVKLSEASRACGYTADHLRVLIRSGKLADYGRPHAPRVRLDELPKKPGHQPGALTPARAVANLHARIVRNATTAPKRRQRMAASRKRGWSWATGKKGKNRVRV